MSAPTRLPDLPASVRFLDRPPLHLATALRGQVAVLLFWRAGCLHSRNALADVAGFVRARRRERRPFAVIAVHVAVEPIERDERRVATAAAPHRDAVTIAVDPARELARAFGVRALPTLTLIDSDGAIRFCGRGEPVSDRFDAAIDLLLGELTAHGRRDQAADVAALPLLPVLPAARPRLLPTALASDGERLWLASAARHSVLEIAPRGVVACEVPACRQPAGLAFAGGQLLASAQLAHELCAIDLEHARSVAVLGVGVRGSDRFGGGFGDLQPLSSPAGICVHDGAVWFAQAAGHQSWQFDPDTRSASAALGTGERGLVDGGERAAFSEPIGLCAGERKLYVADAGNGALRAVELAHNFVTTVAQGLARPVAVTCRPRPDGDGDEVFTAASWQPAIVRVVGGERVTVCGAEAGLVEPVGLAFCRGELWVADVGADALFAIDVDAVPARVRRLELALPPLPAGAADERGSRREAIARLAAPIRLREYADVTLRIALPVGDPRQPQEIEQLDTTAPAVIDVLDEGTPVLAAARHTVVDLAGDHAAALVPIAERGTGVLRVGVRVTVRTGPAADPAEREFCYVVPVEVGPDGALEAEIRAVTA
ncbi:MAG: redoxin domain-containing protein [Planctomycetes bacterium]|nr:redoxin domain-containing protein [Planctomycetota bacterium]